MISDRPILFRTDLPPEISQTSNTSTCYYRLTTVMSKIERVFAGHDGDFAEAQIVQNAKLDKTLSSHQDLAYLSQQGKRQQFKVRYNNSTFSSLSV